MNTTKRTKRPIEFYQMAWDLFHADQRSLPKYRKAMDAFRDSDEYHQCGLSGCMTTKTYALSYMMDDVRRKVEGAVQN